MPNAPGSVRFAACLPFTLKVEGGYSNNRDDAGNWSTGTAGQGTFIGTNHGISAPALIRWRRHMVTAADMKALTVEEASAIAAADYWNPIRGDDLGAGVDLSVFDHQYLSGPYGAICLQRALGMTGADVDGWIGDLTVKAVRAADGAKLAAGLTNEAATMVQAALGLKTDGKPGPKTQGACADHPTAALVGALYDKQMAFYHSCDDWRLFGKGWASRASLRCLTALKMAIEQDVAA